MCKLSNYVPMATLLYNKSKRKTTVVYQSDKFITHTNNLRILQQVITYGNIVV